ncbi:AraC family transcriptional regulator ligand-binding domain-containing protein [Paraburkholderia diazotrophica]|uniref:Arabinose-binding domain of AraC transcription regulator, N-term n=1 Tax=Paraburkholderia diazotrophica TaxID=667676 RepID=A0A1H7C642_9BURK|nr:AraC family transcriptional regulator ligand-binding domain-containing protein [Paraburkholderia diazotrophica]SEJ85249.1 Arabinose-binding domain of AraC transcription regulator, N-term [Paraburkholderia diazotrophica]
MNGGSQRLHFLEVARLVGLNPYQQLRDAGIEQSVLLDPDIMIPAEAVARLLETSARSAAVEDLGLGIQRFELRGYERDPRKTRCLVTSS